MAKTVEMMDNTTKIDGRTRAGRAAKAAAGQAVQQQPVSMEQGPRTRVGGRIEARGRDGEVLSRKRTGTADPFHIDPKIIPPGWEYQWNAVSVVGNQEVLIDQTLQMAENGWRPVPATRHPGRFMPAGHTGSIIRGGQRLEERPFELSQEARQEDYNKARNQLRDSAQSHKMGDLTKTMPSGFAMDKAVHKDTGGAIKMSMDKAIDIPRPQHTLAEAGE